MKSFKQSLCFLSQDESNNQIFYEICFNVEALIPPVIVATSKLEKLLSQIVNILDEQRGHSSSSTCNLAVHSI